MNCAFDKEKLSAFYDGELAAAEKAEVERHIASCSECLRDLGELKSAALLVKELPRLRAPQSIAEGVAREIQAAGKVHVMARFRRTVLWVSAAAAGLFVMVNVLYLSGARKESAPMASMAPTVAQVAPAREQEPEAPKVAFGNAQESLRELKDQKEADRATRDAAAPAAARRKEELAKAAEGGDKMIQGRLVEESRKQDPRAFEAEKAAAPTAKAPAPQTAPPSAPAEAKPAAAPPPAPVAKPAAPEPLARKELDAGSDLKKAVATASADAAPLQYSCVFTTTTAKMKPRIEDSLRKLNLTPVPPPPQAKMPRNREAENTVVVDMTDSQLLKLREELEKAGDVRLVAFAANSLDPVLPGFKTGGIYEKKKDTASGGGKAPAPVPAAKDSAGEKADERAEAAQAEPKRRITLHLVEQKSLPPVDSPTPAEKKN